MCENIQLIERLSERHCHPAKVVVFDFDGTIGMVRADWMPLMLEMMMETLRPLSSDWSALFLEAEDYVARLTGRDTVEQTNAFAEHVGRLGGKPASGQEYKAEFLRRLESLRRGRLEALRAGRMTGDELMIPGARALLEALRGLDLPLYLASGSDHSDISMESGLLGITGYFTGIYGSAPGVPSKQELLNLLLDKGFEAESILMFGDGRTEIELTHAIGGRTVGVASDEPDCVKVDPKKRRWLIDAGADYIVPNYLEPEIIRTVTCS